MNIDSKTVKDILLNGNYITAEDVHRAEEYAETHSAPFTDFLIAEGLTSKDLIGQAIAESLGIPYSDLNSTPPSKEQVERIPEEFAKKFRVVIFGEAKEGVIISTDTPQNPDLLPGLDGLFPGMGIMVTYSLSEDLDASFMHYQKPLDMRFTEIIAGQGRVAPELLDEIFNTAIVANASDIHLEPLQENVVVRLRVDGVLRGAGRFPREYYENMLNRIKVKSGLRIDEHFSAQDGALRYEKEGMTVDMRTSIVPTIEGEKVVLRVLAAYTHGLTLGDLGLSPAHQHLLETSAGKPFGMILVVGPTGSGKTTTLYALLKLMNSPDVNITTIEDPIEYRIQGINQIQVNLQTDLTFTKGLRSIVRQDPDIILVGEIRDRETVEISVNAALTGHLLYSTFHANDAATSIPRLLDMGVEPFLLASTLELVIAQRLVRKICDHCRYSATVTADELGAKYSKETMCYFTEQTMTFYQGKGCDACGGTGYHGRTAIFEFIQVTQELQNLILNSPSTQEIWNLARKDGAKSLFEDGIEKVKTGVTTLEELLRVALPPEIMHESTGEKTRKSIKK